MGYFILERDEQFMNSVRPMWEGEAPEIGQQGILVSQRQPDVLQLRTMSGAYPDYLEQPIPLISGRLKSLFDAAAPGVLRVPAVLRNPDEIRQELYWLIQPPLINALDGRSEFYKDGSLSRLVIDGERTANYHVFRLSGIREPYIIVSLTMAEGLCRRLCSGIRLRPIEIQ